MRRASILGLGVVLSLAACDGQNASLGGPIDVDTSSPTSVGSIIVPTGTQTHAGKVDLLLMLDNSASMGDKQELLRRSIPDLVRRLVAPNCVDGAGNVVGRSANGDCIAGSLEFEPVTDLHVGILTSSLGNRGGDACSHDSPGSNDRAHLVTRTGTGAPLPHAAGGFLRFGAGGITDPQTLEDDISQLVQGVGTSGCGLEAQLESWYRFLVEPNPYEEVVVTDGVPAFVGTDATILKQRHDFLRPDSLLSLVVLTDEDDSAADPFAANGNGWAFTSTQFPGSPVFRAPSSGTTGPRATSPCATDPLAPECTSCAYATLCQEGWSVPPGVDCAALSSDPVCAAGAYHAANDDDLNVRFFRMKQRFGIDPQYPLDRYVHGLLSAKVPDHLTDHDANGNYVSAHTCDNPIFAGVLPESPADELCHLPPGPRSQKLVVLTVIAGAPPALLHPNMTESDWTAVLGKDPIAYDFSGIDPHMVQSVAPRPGLPPATAPDDADPVHGREWNTVHADLQYACTFALEEPRVCSPATLECDCHADRATNAPLCDATEKTKQLRAKAYPGIRPLQLARMLGDNAVASSICPRAPEPSSGDPIVAYRPAMEELGDRMARSLLPAR